MKKFGEARNKNERFLYQKNWLFQSRIGRIVVSFSRVGNSGFLRKRLGRVYKNRLFLVILISFWKNILLVLLFYVHSQKIHLHSFW